MSRRALPGRTRRARDASIWGLHALSLKDARVAGLLRGTIPRFDLACIVFGALGFFGGIPALRDTFGEHYTTGWSAALVAAAIAALLGLAYPMHLWRIEFVATALLIGLLGIYAVALAIAGAIDADWGRAAIAAAVYAMTELPQWRLRDVARDRELNQWS